MTLQITNLYGPPYWKYIAGSIFFVLFINLLQLIDKDHSTILSMVYMGFPAALLFFAILNVRKHFKISSDNFKLHLPLCISFAFIFLAEEIWEIDEHFLHQNPFPSIADLFYLAFYPFFMLFMMRSLNPIRRLISKKLVAFGALLSISLLIPTFMSAYDFNSNEELLPFLLLLSYPVLDAILIGIAAIGLLLAFSKSSNYYWILMLGGVMVWVFADTTFLYAEITDTYYDGHPVDILFIITYVMWIFALIYDTKTARNQGLIHGFANQSSNKITLSSISKFVIPISWLITISVSIYIMFLLNLFEFPDGIHDKNVALVSLLLGVICALSAIIILVNKNLSQLVHLRETELEEKNIELRKIEKLSVVGQVTARLAHDLRNPLTVIKMGVSLIAHKQKINQKLDDEDISSIQRAVFRISHQADDILDFLKDTKVIKNPSSLKKIIRSCLSYLPQKPGITITLPENDSVINCDSSQIERAFGNLILNSIQAIENTGSIFIRIIEEKDFVKIEFEDTGPGVADQNIPKLFEPLFTTKQVGTGLGLTSCKKIIENHNGRILFKNNPTIFTAVLPR